jgi:hypothetical protein
MSFWNREALLDRRFISYRKGGQRELSMFAENMGGE